MKEIKLMKGNEAVAHAAVRCGADGYFGYPITPQSEVMETLMELRPWESTGMVVLQAESEVSAINMIYGGAAVGKRVITSSSSPGVSLMCEGFSYLAGAELPCVIVNVSRGGPGLGTIQPSKADYFQAVKGGGHGDYRLIVLAPASVQDMYDMVFEGFELAFKYRNPVMILSDGAIGQMMEKIELGPWQPRRDRKFIRENYDEWAVTGRWHGHGNVVTSLELDAHMQEKSNDRLQAKYRELQRSEVRYEQVQCHDADYVLVAYGSSARICSKTVELAREQGLKVGLLRPITLFPFPTEELRALADRGAKGFMAVEMSAGQMVEDVRLAVGCAANVAHFGRYGGVVHTPTEVLGALKELVIEKAK